MFTNKMPGLKRRDLFKLAGWAAIGSTLPMGFRSFAAGEAYQGPLFVCLQVAGGWDVTSLCDPKMNIAGEEEINHWANTGEIQQAGNINYAPFAANQAFFEKYYSRMLVINGVDAQTNSHSAGVTHNWSGRLSEGYPTLTALAASIYGAELPMGFVSAGGYQETANLVRYTSLSDPEGLKGLINGNVTAWNPDRSYRYASDLERIKAYQLQRLLDLQADGTLTPRQRHGLDTYYQARLSRDQLADFANVLPDSDALQPRSQVTQDTSSTLLRQAQVALLGFDAGVSMAADLYVGGFDTHSDHDADHEPMMAHVTQAIDYLWETAESLGLADRLTVFVGSDFGRTPVYNSENGKDHWPIGSAIFMKKGASWANKVVGLTDERHFAIDLNETSLQADSGGRHIYPGDVQRAMRVIAGIDQHPISQAFPINTGAYLDFLS